MALMPNAQMHQGGKIQFSGEKIRQSFNGIDLGALTCRNLRAVKKGRRVNKPGFAFCITTSDFNQGLNESLVSSFPSILHLFVRFLGENLSV